MTQFIRPDDKPLAAPLSESIGKTFDLSDFVVGAHWLGERVLLATGDGAVAAFGGDGERLWRRESLHDGALLATAATDKAILTAGEDGRVLAIDAAGEVAELAALGDVWIEALAASKQAVAVGFGKEVAILGPQGGEKHRFSHPATVMGLGFEPNGRRFAAAYYNGVTISWAAAPDSRRKSLEWKGSHLSALWSPDSRFLVTTMQENALHGWRLQDGQHFRMAGYPAKVRSLSFSRDGKFLASAGAQEVVLWPFSGPNGPINSNAQVAGEMATPATVVVCHPTRDVLAAGTHEGEIALMPLNGAGRPILIDAPHGSRTTALVWSPDGRFMAFGSENGRAGVLDFRESLG
jgi:WD40 repeat protein